MELPDGAAHAPSGERNEAAAPMPSANADTPLPARDVAVHSNDETGSAVEPAAQADGHVQGVGDNAVADAQKLPAGATHWDDADRNETQRRRERRSGAPGKETRRDGILTSRVIINACEWEKRSSSGAAEPLNLRFPAVKAAACVRDQTPHPHSRKVSLGWRKDYYY